MKSDSITPIPWFAPEVDEREKKLVLEVIDSNYLNDGDVTRLFETKVAELIGVKHCVAVTSGTVAITLALMGLGVGPGDEVIVPDFTFIATANAVRLAGAKVKLVDIEPQRLTIDVEKLRTAIGTRTRAVVPVDVNGRGADYGSLEPLVKERGLFLISDSAEGLGSKWNGRCLGTFGDAGCFSFSANKTVTAGQGGMIATNNTDLYHRLRELKDQGRRFQGTGGNDLHPVMGFNFKFTNLQAAVGLAQMEKLPDRLTKARQRDGWYRELLKDCLGITIPPSENGEEITQWADILVQDREKIESALEASNIGYRAFWYPLHTNAPYAVDDAAFENSITVSKKGLWLPSYFGLTREQTEYTADVIRRNSCRS
jgi:perosamine synthetase